MASTEYFEQETFSTNLFNFATTSSSLFLENSVNYYTDGKREENVTSANDIVDEESKNYLALLLVIIPVMTVVGNLLVVISVFRERVLQTATNYIIISMAVADLLVALCVMPFAVYVEVQKGVWRLPKSLCTSYTSIDVCASTASILNLVAISWDRYMAVSKPIEYSRIRQKNRRVFTMIAVVWLLSILIALPMATGLNRLDDTKYCEFTNAVYIITSSLASFFLPCFIMVALYGVVLKKLRQRQSHRQPPNRFFTRSLRPKIQADSYQNNSATNFSTHNFSSVSRVSPSCEIPLDFSTPLDKSAVRRCLQEDESTYQYTDSSPSPPELVPPFGYTLTRANGDSSCTKSSVELESDEDDADDNRRLSASQCSEWSSASSIQRPLSTSNFTTARIVDPKRRPLVALRLSDPESESVPFIDASSNQPTPVREKLSAQVKAACNGALQHLVNTVTSSNASRVHSPQLRRSENQLKGQKQNGPPGVFTELIVNNSVMEANLPNHNSSWTTVRMLAPPTVIVGLAPDAEHMLNVPVHKDSMNHLAPPGQCIVRRESSMSVATLKERLREMAVAANHVDTRKRPKRSKSMRESRQNRKERRATHTLAVVLVVFLVCWLPFFTCHVTNSICMVLSEKTCIDIVAFFLTTWLGYMNSFMNPLIYTIFNPEYRRAFRNILCCRRSGTR